MDAPFSMKIVTDVMFYFGLLGVQALTAAMKTGYDLEYSWAVYFVPLYVMTGYALMEVTKDSWTRFSLVIGSALALFVMVMIGALVDLVLVLEDISPEYVFWILMSVGFSIPFFTFFSFYAVTFWRALSNSVNVCFLIICPSAHGFWSGRRKKTDDSFSEASSYGDSYVGGAAEPAYTCKPAADAPASSETGGLV